jgi:phosphoesterase RecJ-like protein
MKKFFKEISPEFISEFKNKVENADSIVVSSHISPDDDSISTVLAVYYYLVNYLRIDEKKIRMLITGDKLLTWKYFDNFDEIEFVDDIYGNIKDKDLAIFTDGSGWKRFSRREEIKKLKGDTICIDHHPNPEDKFNLHLVVKEATSCAELIYKLFYESEELDPKICEILFLGISGDTGNFKFLKPTDSGVFLIAERLLREGKFDIQTLQSKYKNISTKVFMVLVKIMANSKIMEIPGWPKFMMSWIDTNYAIEASLTDRDISDASSLFTQYLRGVEDITWGVVATPRLHDHATSLSLRSLPGSVSVRVVMEMTKFGGGHDRAAGGKVYNKEPEEALKYLQDWMEKNSPILV